MNDLDALVSAIDLKIRKLIVHNKDLHFENDKLLSEITELKTTISKQEEIIQQLEEKNSVLKLSKTLETKEGNIEAKVKINELVREIDKCIGLLNT